MSRKIEHLSLILTLKVCLLHLLPLSYSSGPMPAGQHRGGNLFSSVIDQGLEWTFSDILPTLVPSIVSLLRDCAAAPWLSPVMRCSLYHKDRPWTQGEIDLNLDFLFYLWIKYLTVSKPYLLHYLNHGYGNIISLPNRVVMRIRRNNNSRVLNPVPHTQ